MASECMDKHFENLHHNIPSQFLNVFGFIDYKHDGSVPWTTENILLSSEYMSVTDFLGIDCEMVGVGNFKISALGRVSIVNEYGFCIYDTFVNPMEEITDYCTEYSGIRAKDLENAPPLDIIVQEVAAIVKGRILVGHAIHNDMEVLKLDHPKAALRDTANFFQHHYGSKRTPSLKNLIQKVFNTTIQDGEHSSIQDAQATLQLYLRFKEDWEKDALERRRKANLEETVTDITCMHVQPRPPDLFTESESIFIRPNKLVGAYYSSEEYKDIQFRLLMEDVLRPLRQDILILKQSKLLNNHYKNIRIAADNSLEKTNFEVKSCKTLMVPIHGNRLEEVDWDDRNIFLSGSLLILSPDNFRTIKCAKVIDIGKNQRNDSVILHLIVNFLMDGPTWEVTDKDRFQMIESKAFFQPYEYTLNFLQDVDLDNFPLKKYIVDAETKANKLSHLLKDTSNEIDFSILMDNVNNSQTKARPLDYQHWPSANQLNLDQSQYEGLQKALTQELTIIQGPPGTGKSHVSLQIVKMLLTNKWLSSSPILIVSYTNHALDELLEPILSFLTDRIHGGNLKKAEQSLLRIGGGCKSDEIIPCTLKFKLDKLREKATNKKTVKSLEKALLKIQGLDFTSNLIRHGIINFKLVPQLMLAELEANEQTKDILKLWNKSQRDMENNVFSWFGLSQESIEVRPQSLTLIHDRMFLLLCNNLGSILNETFPKIPITLEELKGKSLHNDDRYQQCLTRWGFYLFLVGQLAEIVKATQNELNLANNANKELELYVKLNPTLKQARVVGMTTTGAVKYKQMVETKFKSNIMLVEEAAHVLEAYVVASLTEHCTQLILVGDHKQLRPMISDHNLRKDFLDVSLMERLVQNGIAQNNQNWTQLKVQHRMRAEIAKLICPVIYDELENHSDVEQYPSVKGCSKNLFFVHHENPESLECRSRSRYNAYEARYIIGLLSYFTDCGYLPTQITVICTYLAQKTLIENTIINNVKINQIQISTVDGFQGKQNDLIILSLVRNNNDNNVGFLKTDNRVCVALSRARHGLIMIGNMNILAPCSKTWSNINRILTNGNNIGTELPLCHPEMFKLPDTLKYSTFQPSGLRYGAENSYERRHRSTHRQGNVPSQMSSIPRNVENTKTLPCGHIVKSNSFKECHTKITERLSCGHSRRVLCYEKGLKTKCSAAMQKTMECGHIIPTACHKFSAATCTAKVKKIFPCGHQANLTCHNISTNNVTCNANTTRLLFCGHSAIVSCGLDPSKVRCNAKTTEKLSCGHVRRVLCCEKGKSTKCGSIVEKKMDCGHIMPVSCHLLLTATYCVALVKKTFSCGHERHVLCREKNSNMKCPAIIKHTYPCGHLHLFPCLTGVEIAKKCGSFIKRKLPCGHTQSAACHQNPSSIKCRQLITFENSKYECYKFNQIYDDIKNQMDELRNIFADLQLR